jgi:glycosyltransferase involved in cell wall biosynthesis
MKIMITTDAWKPQVNGVVRTLEATARELQSMGHTVDFLTPLEFATVPCPTYPDIRLSLFPAAKAMRRLADFDPDALHIATEGPLGLAARRFALKRRLPYTTAYHTRFPEYVRARTGMPLRWTYAFLRWFHGPAAAVMAPTPVVKRDLESYGFSNVVMWSRGVDVDTFRPRQGEPLKGTHPIFLYVGRVAVEKNIDAFLDLDLPGSKWVAGVGPALKGIQARHPDVHYLGVLDQRTLAEVYSSADVFVFPSRTDTFGLVLLEAMACGLPVAAYPVTGPLDVLGDSRTAGVMHEDLRTACLEALQLRREDAVAYAQKFSWRAATEQFLTHLHPRTQGAKLPGPLANASGA